MSDDIRFEINEDFLSDYKGKQPNWGFGGLGYVVYKRTYSRKLPDGKSEEYWQTLKRVVEGVFTIQKRHCLLNKLPWNTRKANSSAQRMFELMWDFKFTPPGRGLWMMGTEKMWELGSACLQNCAYHSTENITIDFAEPFCFLMDMSMLGVGVGGDVKGAGKITIKQPKISEEPFVVPDTREGWVDLLRVLLNAYVGKNDLPKEIDYSLVRPKGALIKGFGGIASGPQPLMDMYTSIKEILDSRIGDKITSSDIVDIFNLVGKCVVSGGVRRCLPKGTIVHTNRGLVPIEDMKKGMLVRTQFGWKDVTDVVHQGDQEVVTVKTELGEFECTPDHRVKVFKKLDGYEWKQAQELTTDDKLVFLNNIENDEIKAYESILPEWSYEKPKHSTTSVDITIPKLDEDIAWLVGLIQGDGYVTEHEITIAIHRDDEEIINRAKTTLERFGVNVRLSGGTDDDKAVRINVKSNQLGTYFYTHVKQPKISLKVPEFIKSTNIDSIIYSYIAGVFDADGTRTPRPILVVTSIYENFVKELQMLLAYMGIPSKINHRKSTTENWQDKYNLYVIGEKHRRRIVDILFRYSEKLEDYNITDRSQNDYGFSRDWVLESRTKRYNNKVKFYKNWSPTSEQMTECTFERCTGETLNVTPISVLEVIHTKKIVDTYDISVENEHEFAFGFGLLSHNTAEIMFGNYDDEEFLQLKNPEINKDKLYSHRWASNNSVYAEVGMDYSRVASMTATNGEPGYVWLETAKSYSRLKDVIDNKDYRIAGTNPCGEQGLESGELCNLVETYMSNHDTLEEWIETLKYAYLYAKTVTLLPTHRPLSNTIMNRNRRIGTSISGITQAFTKFGRRTVLEAMDDGYTQIQEWDKTYSDWLGIPRSIKTTTIKPSGSVSLLTGVTPGIHYPISEFYIRNIRFQDDDKLLEKLIKSGYKAEKDKYSTNTFVVSFPVKVDNFDRSVDDVSMWEQLEIVAQIQKYWSDNLVSATVTFSKEEAPQIKYALQLYETRLKGVSLLPRIDHGYEQAPYIKITEEQFNEMNAQIKKLNKISEYGHEADDKYCSTDYCEMKIEEEQVKGE